MKAPLFTVGEEVILQCRIPEFNGEYTVYEILTPYETKLRWPNVIVKDEIHYVITEKPFKLEFGNETKAVKQSSLFKKHKPSELSFQELVSSLNTPIKTPIKA